MSSPNNTKKSSNYRVLVMVCSTIHNPQVADAYRPQLDDPGNITDEIYGKYLTIYPDDSVWELLLKLLIFYLVDGRMWVQSTTTMWWAQKAQAFKPQLAIQYRPQGNRKKFGFRNYAGNPEAHIPHYNGEPSPHIPAYTLGRYSAKYTLIDQTYLMVNAHTPEEAIAVLTKLASYTKPDKRPVGTIEENITTNTRRKAPKMDGIKIEPFKAEYFNGGKYGIKSLVKIQL
jgi:hypothetical protein